MRVGVCRSDALQRTDAIAGTRAAVAPGGGVAVQQYILQITYKRGVQQYGGGCGCDAVMHTM